MSKDFSDRLKEVAKKVQAELPGIDFSILVFSKSHPGYSNFVTTTDSQEMVKAMQELIQKVEAGATKKE